MGHDSAVKRTETLAPAATWMNLEAVGLSEEGWSQKDRHCMSPLT